MDTEAVICIFYDHYVVINDIDTIKDQKQQKAAKQKVLKMYVLEQENIHNMYQQQLEKNWN